MEQSPSWRDDNNRSSDQDIQRLLWNQKFHHGIQKSPIPIQIKPIHDLPPDFSKTRFNITFLYAFLLSPRMLYALSISSALIVSS
jgi:hypothetical protein